MTLRTITLATVAASAIVAAIPMKRALLAAVTLATLTFAAVKAADAGPVFTDTTFLGANLTLTPTFISPGGFLAEQVAFPGVPVGTGLKLTGGFSTAVVGQVIDVGFLRNGWTYTPSVSGAITAIDASVIKDLASNFAVTNAGNTFRPFIKQDGIYYMAAVPGPTLTAPAGGGDTGFNTIAGVLHASDFVAFDFATDTTGTAHPNFAGDTMTFGLGQIFGINNAGSLTATYADLNLAIITPEPATLGLLGTGLLGLGLTTFRRRRA